MKHFPFLLKNPELMILQIASSFSVIPKLTTTKSNRCKYRHSNPTTTRITASKVHSGIPSNMMWADLRAAIGQRLNCEGIISSAKVIVKDHNLAIPHLSVPDIRWINWSELRRRGFHGVVFDKDNTLTLPYSLTLWAPLKPSLERCKSEFGDDNVAVFSNTAGLFEFDPDGSKARQLEREIGIKVIKHKAKKPAGNAEEIEKHFGCPASMLVMVGDRHFTDVVYGNRNGFLTVLTQPLSVKGEPVVVRLVRRFESALVHRWSKKGLKPIGHSLLGDRHLDLVTDRPETQL